MSRFVSTFLPLIRKGDMPRLDGLSVLQRGTHATFLTLLVMSASLSGCFGDDEDEALTEPSPTSVPQGDKVLEYGGRNAYWSQERR